MEVNVFHFSSAVSACDKPLDFLRVDLAMRSSRWTLALQLLAEMPPAQVESNAGQEAQALKRLEVFTYGSAISACEKASRWQEALSLLRRDVNAYAFSGAISVPWTAFISI